MTLTLSEADREWGGGRLNHKATVAVCAPDANIFLDKMAEQLGSDMSNLSALCVRYDFSISLSKMIKLM